MPVKRTLVIKLPELEADDSPTSTAKENTSVATLPLTVYLPTTTI
jgi:hypothetical protein